MAHVIRDRVRETTAVTGTGALTPTGAVSGVFRTFTSVLAASDTCPYVIEHQSASEWESGLGTWDGTTLTRTTIKQSSNSNAAVNFSAGTKHVFIAPSSSDVKPIGDVDVVTAPALDDSLLGWDTTADAAGLYPIQDLTKGIGLKLHSLAANPAPPSGGVQIYSRSIAGRHMPKWIGPAGVDTYMQPALFFNRFLMYMPSSGTVGTGSGTGLGPAWTSGGTVSHPTPATTAPAITNQMKRTRWANVATTTNQTLGVRFNVASERQFWRGNAAGLGGFFFVARFSVELIPASTVRLFVGLVGNNSTHPTASDTMINDVCGLWHDTTDPLSGANSLNFVTRDATETSKQSIALTNAIAAGNSYDFYMFCAPNGSEIFWRLDDIVNGVTYQNSTSTTLPRNTIFLQPMASMSNGTANLTATTTAFGLAGLYVESDR